MVHGHYYSEDYELEWAAKSYFESLRPDERGVMESVLIRRLSGPSGIADVSMCTRLGLPALTPFLVARLEKEDDSSTVSRAILAALSNQPDEQAYSAVERFIDSELEGEALQCLARINFRRAMPHMRMAIQKDHLHNYCLHAIHEFVRREGVQSGAEVLREIIEPNEEWLARHTEKILMSKQGRFNPFSDQELAYLMATLQ